jgi:hypothetical protein
VDVDLRQAVACVVRRPGVLDPGRDLIAGAPVGRSPVFTVVDEYDYDALVNAASGVGKNYDMYRRLLKLLTKNKASFLVTAFDPKRASEVTRRDQLNP